MFFTLPGLIFNIIGVLALMRSEWLQNQGTAPEDHHEHSDERSHAWLFQTDPAEASSLFMLGGVALLIGFSLHIAALFA